MVPTVEKTLCKKKPALPYLGTISQHTRTKLQMLLNCQNGT